MKATCHLIPSANTWAPVKGRAPYWAGSGHFLQKSRSTLRTIVNWKWFKKTFHHNLGFYQTEVFTHYPLKTVFNRTLCKTLFLTKNLLQNSNSCSVVSTVHCLTLFPKLSLIIFFNKGLTSSILWNETYFVKQIRTLQTMFMYVLPIKLYHRRINPSILFNLLNNQHQ